jgi:acetyl-CoA acyltransferase
MMSKQIQDAYIVAATRTPVGKAPRGKLRNVRPDDLLAHALKSALAQVPSLDPKAVEDVVVGCAMPEGEQGFNFARIGLLLAGLPNTVGGITVNRFCSSGLNAVAIAADRIRVGEADVMIGAGAESMSMVPMTGFHPSFNERIYTDENYGIAYGMGMTAERVASQWKVSREAQDEFAYASHQRALAAQQAGEFSEITPFAIEEKLPNLATGKVDVRTSKFAADEGPRADTNVEALGKLRAVFAARGSVTAGNSSQTSDGAGAVVLMSEKALKQFGVTPLARYVSFAVAGVASSKINSTGSNSTKRLPRRRSL